MTREQLKDLARHSANRTAPTNYSVESVDAAVRDELRQMSSTVNNFMRNRWDIYDIIIENADAIVPKKMLETLGQFCEIRNVPQGQKILFKVKKGRNRAKKFVTQVGLSGVYETFRLDLDYFELGMKARGGAASIDWERFLDDADMMPELMDIIADGLTEAALLEVQNALIAAYSSAKIQHSAVANGFNGALMQKLIGKVKAYGENAVIFATPEFIEAMGPDAIVPAISGAAQGIYHPDDIDAIHNTGRIRIFRGTPIVEIKQSFVDEANNQVYINPQFAYILPTGGEKVVKLGFEGSTQIHDFTNPDHSMEIHTYKKMGAAILSYHNWAIYRNVGIDTTEVTVYENAGIEKADFEKNWNQYASGEGEDFYHPGAMPLND